MDRVWMERGAFLSHEAEFLSNTLKGLAANYTIIMRAAKGEDEVNHLNAMQTRIEEIVKAEFETLKNAFCENGVVVVDEDRPRTILTPDKAADKTLVNRYVLTDTKAIVDCTTARALVDDEENHEILRMIADLKGVESEELGWFNYWDGILPLTDKPIFQKGDIVYEVARLAPTEDRKEQYSIVVKAGKECVWSMVKTEALAWFGRGVK